MTVLSEADQPTGPAPRGQVDWPAFSVAGIGVVSGLRPRGQRRPIETGCLAGVTARSDAFRRMRAGSSYPTFGS